MGACLSPAAKKPAAAEATPKQALLFAVHHKFRKPEEFWAKVGGLLSDAEAYASWTAAVKDAGFINHYFLPEGGEKDALCIWEAKDEAAAAKFQEFIDGPMGPAGSGLAENLSFRCMAGAGVVPAARFAGAAAPPAVPSTGSFLWVHHTFADKAKAGAWWEGMKTLDWGAMVAKHHALGYHNHIFLPSSADGDVYCVWECKDAAAAANFQAFIDGPDGPGQGVFVNHVHPVTPEGMTPPAFFAAGPPLPVARFFEGTARSDAYLGTIADEYSASFQLSFVGPHTPAGMPTMTKETLPMALSNLLASFPDLTFSAVEPVKEVAPGKWAALTEVTGTHTGAPYSPAPHLPKIAKTGKAVKIGPEIFTLTLDAEGKVAAVEIECLHAGAPVGPPGFYRCIGGTLAPPPAAAGKAPVPTTGSRPRTDSACEAAI